MQNTEIFRHPKSTKLSLYVRNPAQDRPKLSTSFPGLHAKDKHSYNTRSATRNLLLDIPFTKTNMYGKNSIKTIALEIGTI